MISSSGREHRSTNPNKSVSVLWQTLVFIETKIRMVRILTKETRVP